MKKGLVKVTAVLCAATLGMGLAGCGLKAPEVKVEEGTVRIAVLDRGYGKQFAYDLAEAFSAKSAETGYKAQVTFDTTDTAGITNMMEMGIDNECDVFFSESSPVFEWLARKNTFVPGYEYGLADMEDILNAPADPAYKETQENPDLTNRDIINASVLDQLTLDENGKVYALPWTTDITGIYYNHNVLTELNANLGEGDKIELPKTTDEMFDVMDKVKSLRSGEDDPYPFTFGNQQNYLDNCAFTTWWGQYAGAEEMNNFRQGKNMEGEYTPEIFNRPARLAALEVMRELLNQSNGYADISDYDLHVFMSQDKFFEGDALFHFNGGWLEREQSEKFETSEYDVRSFKMPVVSSIVDKWPEVFTGTDDEKDDQLRAALDYIDGEGEKPSFLEGHDDVLESLRQARNTISSKGVHMNTFIPACAENLEGAKEFVKFMLSKEGQEIMMKGSWGNLCGLVIDPTQLDCYATATETQKSRLDVYCDSEVVVGFAKKYPMEYLSGLVPYRDGVSPQKSFAALNPISAEDYRKNEVSDYTLRWNAMLSQAGIKK